MKDKLRPIKDAIAVGDKDRARQLLRPLLHKPAVETLILAAQVASSKTQAVKLLGYALFLDPDSQETANQLIECLTVPDRAANVLPEGMQAGLTALQTDSSESGLAHASSVISGNSQSAEHFYHRSIARADNLDLQGAVEDYTRAIRLDPGLEKHDPLRFALLYFNWAYVHRKLVWRDTQNLDQCNAAAITDFSTAIRLNPQFGAAYLRRAYCYYGKDEQKAHADFSEALRFNAQLIDPHEFLSPMSPNYDEIERLTNLPDSQVILDYSGEFYFQRAQRCSGRAAIRDFSRAIQINPQGIELYNERGATYAELGDWQHAVADLTVVLRATPDAIHTDPEMSVRRMGYRFNMEDFYGAIGDCSALLDAGAGIYFLFLRGMAHLLAGLLKQAFTDFQAYIRSQPQAPYPYYGRARVHEAEGKVAEAIEDYEKCITLGGLGGSSGISISPTPEEALRLLKQSTNKPEATENTRNRSYDDYDDGSDPLLGFPDRETLDQWLEDN